MEILSLTAVTLLVLALALSIPYYAAFGSSPNLLDQYRLSDSRSTAIGEIVESDEEFEPSDSGGGVYYWTARIQYQTNSGANIEALISGSTPASAKPPLGQVMVRYLPNDPQTILIDGMADGGEWRESKWPRSKDEFWAQNRLRVFGCILAAAFFFFAMGRHWFKEAKAIISGQKLEE